MNRIDKTCCGDCAKCTLLANSEVDMVPCVLDQLLRRVIKLERLLAEEDKAVRLAAEDGKLNN